MHIAVKFFPNQAECSSQKKSVTIHRETRKREKGAENNYVNSVHYTHCSTPMAKQK